MSTETDAIRMLLRENELKRLLEKHFASPLRCAARKTDDLEKRFVAACEMLDSKDREIGILKGLLATQTVKCNAVVAQLQGQVDALSKCLIKAKQCEPGPVISMDSELLETVDRRERKINSLRKLRKKDSEKINDLTRERDNLEDQADAVRSVLLGGLDRDKDRGDGTRALAVAAVNGLHWRNKEIGNLQKQLLERPDVLPTECYFRRHQVFLGTSQDGIGTLLCRNEFKKWFAAQIEARNTLMQPGLIRTGLYFLRYEVLLRTPTFITPLHSDPLIQFIVWHKRQVPSAYTWAWSTKAPTK